jgi:hypothetical protein
MITLQEFHQDFLQSILSDSESRGIMKPQSFFEFVCEDLLEIGDLTSNYTHAEYIKKGIEVYGYDFDEERKILTILSHQFFQEDDIQTLTKSIIDNKFSRLRTFCEKCFSGLYSSLEETSEAYSMAYNIYRYAENQKFDKIRFMILSEGKISRTLADIPSETINGIKYDYRVIDIEYLYKIYTTSPNNGSSSINVNLPCLKINNESNSYQSYLSVIPGNLLVEIYEQNGQKLFEQNVRTFLQFKGNVNKGLRTTIEYKPEMFFAYNNGITATASSIDFNEEGNIQVIHNFQIVNGGQTTSAIYAAKKNSNLDVSMVAVQMKLSVVKNPDKQDDFISKVAEYANTQNKINNSDFFSNSPFHKDIKEYSLRVFAPTIGGSQRRTHWYYERVRGEYLNNQAYLNADAKKKFQLENPKAQVVDKTLLSKTENVWQQRPDIVSKGAQDSFKKFADKITETLEKDNLAITEEYFKDAIARVILFRSVERLITNSSWYDGGYRAQTVAYTISYLSALVEFSGLYLNFTLIWENQCLPNSLIKMLEVISEMVYSKITHPPTGYANISQYAKTALCWETIKNVPLDFEELDSSLFISHEDKKFIVKESKVIKAVDNGIHAQVAVVNIKNKEWIAVFEYYSKNKSNLKLTFMQSDMLEKMAQGRISLPSEKQSKILHDLYLNAIKEGFIFNAN